MRYNHDTGAPSLRKEGEQSLPRVVISLVSPDNSLSLHRQWTKQYVATCNLEFHFGSFRQQSAMLILPSCAGHATIFDRENLVLKLF